MLIKTQAYITENLDPLFAKLPTKYKGAKYDAHVHLGGEADIKKHLQYASQFNVTRTLGLIKDDRKAEFDRLFPHTFRYARFLSHAEILRTRIKSILETIEESYSKEYAALKLWFAPKWRDYGSTRGWEISVNDLRLDDPLLEPIFAKIEDLGMPLLIHVSDPDLWYEQKYVPEGKYGSKKRHLEEMETVLIRHPKLRMVGAHLAAQPEDLRNLARWLDTYPNLMVDLSSARWMAREFSSKPKESRDFLNKYSDRLMFGTDIVTGRTDRGAIPGYFVDRYMVYKALFESNVTGLPLPFPDPENGNNTVINGLDLPLATLKKIYWFNAERTYG